MKYARMVIEKESPEEYGYDRIRFNLSESSVRDRKLSDFGLSIPDLLLPYGEHRGDPQLRALVAAQGKGLIAEDVLVTSGAAGALFIVATTLLSRDEHLIVVRPNYATNIETPRAIGCDITFIDLDFDKDFSLDIEKIAQAVRPQTRYVSITCPHNPTGTMISRTQLDALVALVEKSGCRLLVDETYRDLTHGEMLPLAASLSPSVISVASLSKAYGAPGIRVGWIVTRDAALMEHFLAAKEQIGICGSVVDEWIGARILERRDAFLAAQAPDLAKRLAIVRDWVENDPLIEWIEPQGGVVCFPRFRHGPRFDFEDFYADLLEGYGTYVGPGHWFEMPRNHMRIGFLYPHEDELRGGLAAISAAIRKHSARQG
ncbi:aspartate/methionine/tyrosine aminotransferase [Mesorhizobium soli]|uniref:aminotransferase class I/II-fold pyridoxal phosphate-dependent enzyme n=1 Tax=Pseudaminobacter soli (ex Li et al. 2025) TaxID=1295366 RepID=UPI002473F6BE|nr:aminotransferase class I/II-fold pyridoxal phosphate-dependent enzyme [Mesorhizobium soli]MDH6234544.1 aspartate/methionine/tyrosine aminotransferase [Mesorhizobium soli]